MTKKPLQEVEELAEKYKGCAHRFTEEYVAIQVGELIIKEVLKEAQGKNEQEKLLTKRRLR